LPSTSTSTSTSTVTLPPPATQHHQSSAKAEKQNGRGVPSKDSVAEQTSEEKETPKEPHEPGAMGFVEAIGVLKTMLESEVHPSRRRIQEFASFPSTSMDVENGENDDTCLPHKMRSKNPKLSS
jgi:hypothetical protein